VATLLEDDLAQLSQLEQDHQFALKLQAELSGGSSRDVKSPPPFSFDIASDRDCQLARRLSQEAESDNEEDLPDISLTALYRTTPVKDSNTNHLLRGRTTPVKDSNTNQPLTDLGNANTDYKVPAPRTRHVPAHNISVVSSDDEEVAAATSDPLDKLFANDPVFNMGKKTAKGKSKTKPDKSQPIADTSENVSKKTPSRRKKVAAPATPASTPKSYVPKARSGCYAVLLTLSQHSAEPGYPGYLTKAELCEAAQPLADQSFTLASVRAEHYNAWSGVGTLLKHGLVTKWSNPAKFNITDKGLELAKRILSIERGEEGGEDSINMSVKRRLESESGGQKRKARKVIGQSGGGKKENTKKRPNVKLRNDSHKITSGVDDPTDSADDDLMLAIELSRKEAAVSASSQAMTSGGAEAMKGLGVSAVDFNLGDSFNMEQTMNEEDFAVPGPSRSPPVDQPSTTNTTSSTLPLPLALAAMYKMQMSAAGPQADAHRPDFVLRGGGFDILLCVDNTETAGGGVGGRKTLKVETVRHLQQCGVMYDRRNLNIGDFLWIARERVGEVGGQFRQKQPRELVLPFIVERKRLDDLWMSVKDGRYEEQKFRMKGCGLPHLYYLIEDHPGQKQLWGRAGQGGALVTPEAIEQAVANTAVQEGFTVKKTADQKGTIEYLTLVTRLLRDKYKNLDLTSCTHSDLADGLVGRRDTTLLAFQEFNDSSRKTKPLTVTEVFAKMLLRLKGLSVDMAQTIVRLYPTPRDLMEAYAMCGNGVERVKLIADLAYGLEGKRKIPKAVAEALLKFWTSPSLV
jgi:ERCC4-type nuclease